MKKYFKKSYLRVSELKVNRQSTCFRSSFKFPAFIYKIFFTLIIQVFMLSSMANGQNIELPKEKQTTLGLYVTAKDAYEKWKASDGKILLLDVRTTEEYIFVGHSAMAYNIPAFTQSYKWDDSKNKFPMQPNPDFVKQVLEIVKKTDTLFVMCRSGGRSALAVNKLAESGFSQVYNITDGMEGDVVKDPQSLFLGQHLVNGWKNSGLPWTYDINPKLMIIPENR